MAFQIILWYANFVVAVVLMFKMLYNNGAISRRNDRSRKDFVFSAEEGFAFFSVECVEACPFCTEGIVFSDEESPGFTGQDAG